MFEAIRTIGTIEAFCGFHIIASTASKSDTARFEPGWGGATLFWRESCKTKKTDDNRLQICGPARKLENYFLLVWSSFYRVGRRSFDWFVSPFIRFRRNLFEFFLILVKRAKTYAARVCSYYYFTIIDIDGSLTP